MTVLFISDLHLDDSRPQITECFLRFLHDRASQVSCLYILGDLFEAWIGDDEDSALSGQVARALNRLHSHAVAVYFIHGNRDFLLGPAYAARCGLQLLLEPAIVTLNRVPTLILHGDSLCTDDTDYQAFRRKVRNPRWQQQVLALALSERRQLARQLRADSQMAMTGKTPWITDVNHQAVKRLLRCYGLNAMIHGHTHRPAIHHFQLDGHPAQRAVLGDWYEQGSVLRIEPDGYHLETLPA